MSSHFDEKSGVVCCNTQWGRWYQTVDEVVLEIDCEPGTRGKEVAIKIKSKSLSCFVRGKEIIEGDLFENIVVDESTWIIEDRKLIRVQLAKAIKSKNCWKSLLLKKDSGESYEADPLTLDRMQKKQTLENYQLEHPGFDFSSAELTGNYGN